MSLARAFHLAQQCALLAGLELVVLLALAAIGLWAVLEFFPPAAALRWIIFAPIAGLAVITAVALPCARLGIPVGRLVGPVTMVASLLSIASLAQKLRRSAGRRLVLSYGRARGGALLLVFTAVVFISTWLITAAGRGGVRDIWGSTDFGAYWVVPDYLRDHGATLESYRAQSTFRASDVFDHLQKHARLGCMVGLAFLAAVADPSETQHVVLPFLVAMLTLLVGLVLCWFEWENSRWRWLLPLFLVHPFLYFLLYFTYASQASGVLLFIAGLLMGEHAHRSANRRLGIRWAVVCGILMGAAIVHPPAIIVAAVILWVVQAVIGRQPNARIFTAVAAGTALLAYAYYLPQVLRELLWAGRSGAAQGWRWHGLVGSLEFVGVRSVLGYDLPEPRTSLSALAELTASVGVIALLWHGVRRSRFRSGALTLVITTGLLAAIALVKFFQHVPNATHAFVKVISLYALFLGVICLAPVARHALPRLPRLHAVGLAAALGLLVLGQLRAVYRNSAQAVVFSDDLVALARRHLAPGTTLQFDPWLHPLALAPIVRDENRIADAPGTARIAFRDARLLTADDVANVIDHEGSYVALRVTARN